MARAIRSGCVVSPFPNLLQIGRTKRTRIVYNYLKKSHEAVDAGRSVLYESV